MWGKQSNVCHVVTFFLRCPKQEPYGRHNRMRTRARLYRRPGRQPTQRKHTAESKTVQRKKLAICMCGVSVSVLCYHAPVIAGSLDYIPFLVEVRLTLFLATVFEAGCGASNTQMFFPPGGARLVVAGGLSTPKRGKPRAPIRRATRFATWRGQAPKYKGNAPQCPEALAQPPGQGPGPRQATHGGQDALAQPPGQSPGAPASHPRGPGHPGKAAQEARKHGKAIQGGGPDAPAAGPGSQRQKFPGLGSIPL